MFLQVRELSYIREHKPVLNGLSLQLQSGEITAILGANGSGKSTLLRLLAGLLEPEDGEIVFENKRVLGPSYQLIPGHPDIALVKQDNKLFPLHTVKQNLRRVLQFEKKTDQEEKIDALSNLLGLRSYLDRVLKQLSGGEQQRVAIAASLASNPKLLLMDEPFNQTDMYLKLELKQYLKEVVGKMKTTILFVTHDPSDALSMADRLMILHEGKIVEEGTPKEIYYRPKYASSAVLTGYCNWLNLKDSEQFSNLHLVENRYLIRPDKISISLNPTSNNFLFKVIEIKFMGFYYLIKLLSEDQKVTLLSTQPTTNELTYGDKVWVSFETFY